MLKKEDERVDKEEEDIEDQIVEDIIVDEDEIQEHQLDDTWIQSFETKEQLYKDYYLEDVYFIHLHFIYVDRCNNIEKIKEETYLLSIKNEITRDEIIKILKRCTKYEQKNYSMISLLKCNIILSPEDITKFVSFSPSYNFTEFLTPIKTIDNVKFEKTINMFQDLNDLIFVLYEKPRSIMTRRRGNKCDDESDLSTDLKKRKSHNKTVRKST